MQEATKPLEKTLPFALESEQIVLGSLIMQPEMILDCIEILKPGDFYRKSHRTIYAAMCLFYNKHSEPADFIALTDLLEKKQKLASIGGSGYLTEIGFYATTYTLFDYHVTQIEQKAEFRALASAAADMAVLAYGEEENALAKAEELLYRISKDRAVVDLVSGEQTMSDYIQRLSIRERQANEGKPIGIATGFTDLDQLLGGLLPQDLYILGGRPGNGKTSFLLNIMLNLIERGLSRIAMYSLEMSRFDLANRLVSMKSGVNSQDLRTRSLDSEQWDQVIAASDALATDTWFVDESGKLSISAIRHKCRRHKAQHGLDLVIVDYLQMMDGEEVPGKRQYNRVQEVGEVSRGLKQLAKDLDVPVLAAASLSRASESRANKRPQLSDLRESGSIESDADVVMFISRQVAIDQVSPYSVIDIAKHRNGAVGEISLFFDAPLTKFRDLGEEMHV